MGEESAVLIILQDELKAITADLATLQSELIRLNDELAHAKPFKRGGLRKAITNLEQQIKKRTSDRNKTQENISEALLAVKGIDQDTGKAGAVGGAVSSGLQSVASVVGSIMGAPGKTDVGGLTESNKSMEIPVKQDETKGLFGKKEEPKQDNKNMIYIIIGAVALVVLMMFKKK